MVFFFVTRYLSIDNKTNNIVQHKNELLTLAFLRSITKIKNSSQGELSNNKRILFHIGKMYVV